MDHLSSSQINLYLQCSLKYKFSYIDRLPKPFKPSGLAFGSAIHSTLNWLHKERMNGNGVTLDKLYKIFGADWYAQNVGTDIRFKNGETMAELDLVGKEMLAQYFHSPHNGIKGSEIPFVIPLVNSATGEVLSVNLEGFFDLLESDDTIVEFKTSNQAMNQDSVNEHLQLSAYSYAYEMLYQKPPKALRIIDFVKTKKPKMIVLETKRCKADHQRFFNLASQVLKGIESEIFIPQPSFICKGCEYSGHCKTWGTN